MTNGFQQVQPGDLITSELMNTILARLEDLHQRLSNLEAGTGEGVTITGFDPPVEARVNDTLTIIGTNFVVPFTRNIVTIGGVEVPDFLPGTGETRLRFTIPPVPNLPDAGREVLVNVQNSRGFAQRFYRLLPPDQSGGPAPSITNVTRASNGEQILVIGQDALIVGQNFAGTAEGNQLTFRYGAADPYPRPGQSLQFTPTGSPTTRIQVQVPNISEISTDDGVVTVSIEVRVGSQESQPFSALIQR